MVTFDSLNLDNSIPIYQQIVDYIRRGIVAGTITDGDELPSRRTVSALLGVNPNTIQKAFRMLEEEGLIESRAGAKSCVRVTDALVRQVRCDMTEQEVGSMIRKVKAMGMEKESLYELIEQLWEEETYE